MKEKKRKKKKKKKKKTTTTCYARTHFYLICIRNSCCVLQIEIKLTFAPRIYSLPNNVRLINSRKMR